MAESVNTGRLVAIFLLACVLFSHPILTLFNIKILVMGIPLLYLYVFGVWCGLIVLVFAIMRARVKPPGSETVPGPHGADPSEPG
jgi:hypothetical protein